MLNYKFIIPRYPIIQLILDTIFSIILLPIVKISRLRNNEGENIVIISLHKLGDTVFTIPAVQQIQKKFNDKIYILCYPETKCIYQEIIKNIEYITFNENDFYFNGRIAERKVRKKIKDLNPKILFDLTLSIKSASMIFNSAAKYIIGSNDPHFKILYTHFSEIRERPHLMMKYLDVVSSFFEVQNEFINNNLTESNFDTNMIIIHPFAGWKAKEWSLRRYIQLAKQLKSKYEVGIIVGNSEIEPDVEMEIKNSNVKIIKTESVSELISEIKKCFVFIGNDSGPINIAALLYNKLTYTLFGPTNPEFHKVKGEHYQYLSKKINCSPAENKKYCFTFAGMNSCPSYQCMNSISYNITVDKTSNLIKNFSKHKIY